MNLIQILIKDMKMKKDLHETNQIKELNEQYLDVLKSGTVDKKHLRKMKKLPVSESFLKKVDELYDKVSTIDDCIGETDFTKKGFALKELVDKLQDKGKLKIARKNFKYSQFLEGALEEYITAELEEASILAQEDSVREIKSLKDQGYFDFEKMGYNFDRTNLESKSRGATGSYCVRSLSMSYLEQSIKKHGKFADLSQKDRTRAMLELYSDGIIRKLVCFGGEYRSNLAREEDVERYLSFESHLLDCVVEDATDESYRLTDKQLNSFKSCLSSFNANSTPTTT